VNIVHNDVLDIEAFKKWNPEYASAEFILEPDGKYHCGWAVEKMSKSLYNVVNPDDIIEKYGADTLRMYEMFLGPLEQSKPWDTNGIEGVHKFYRKLWKLFHNSQNQLDISDEDPELEELKIIHKTIKKIGEDIENFSFNTSVSAFMICVNELSSLKCNKRKILNDLIIILSPFAPHIAEELWELSGNQPSVSNAVFPKYNPQYLVEDMVEYPVSFNGKMRLKIKLKADLTPAEIESEVLKDEGVLKFLKGGAPKKVIVVPGKIVNIVI
jgi:leucyl-tRNA synthetase